MWEKAPRVLQIIQVALIFMKYSLHVGLILSWDFFSVRDFWKQLEKWQSVIVGKILFPPEKIFLTYYW